MATTNSESLTELERRAESTRAELAQTVDALHSRVSPSALKADVRSYVRENPLQAAALAVGVAYPVWRLIGSIPAPVLLIGAGLAMSRRNGGSGHGASYGNGHVTGSMAGGGMMASLKEKASDLGSAIAEKAQDTIDNVRNVASDTATQASGRLSDTYHSSRDAAAETAHQVADQVTDTYARTRDNLADMIERHPLLVGGVAFAVGSLVASAVPVSRQESRLMGESADDVKRRAGDLALQGLSEARSAAQHVYETAAEEVRTEGLTPEAARHTARVAMESAREAVEQTASAAQQPGGRSGRSSRNPSN